MKRIILVACLISSFRPHKSRRAKVNAQPTFPLLKPTNYQQQGILHV